MQQSFTLRWCTRRVPAMLAIGCQHFGKTLLPYLADRSKCPSSPCWAPPPASVSIPPVTCAHETQDALLEALQIISGHIAMSNHLISNVGKENAWKFSSVRCRSP
eukprot:200453-Pelagomonas_calceolata.AAC.10